MPEQRDLCPGHWRALVRSRWLLRLSLEATVYVSIVWAIQAWLLRCGLWMPPTQTLISFSRAVPMFLMSPGDMPLVPFPNPTAPRHWALGESHSPPTMSGLKCEEGGTWRTLDSHLGDSRADSAHWLVLELVVIAFILILLFINHFSSTYI